MRNKTFIFWFFPLLAEKILQVSSFLAYTVGARIVLPFWIVVPSLGSEKFEKFSTQLWTTPHPTSLLPGAERETDSIFSKYSGDAHAAGLQTTV